MALTGTSAALAELVQQAGPLDDQPEPEQLGLAVGPLAPTAAPTAPRRRGPNRSTKEMLEYLAARFRHPLLVLAETWSRPVADLAAELGCDRLEAYDRQLRALSESLPFWASKQPVAVQVTGEGAFNLVILDPAKIAAMASPAADGSMPLPAAQEIDQDGNPIEPRT